MCLSSSRSLPGKKHKGNILMDLFLTEHKSLVYGGEEEEVGSWGWESIPISSLDMRDPSGTFEGTFSQSVHSQPPPPPTYNPAQEGGLRSDKQVFLECLEAIWTNLAGLHQQFVGFRATHSIGMIRNGFEKVLQCPFRCKNLTEWPPGLPQTHSPRVPSFSKSQLPCLGPRA